MEYIESVSDALKIVEGLRPKKNHGSIFFRGEAKDYGELRCCPAIYRKEMWQKRERFFYNEAKARFPEAFVHEDVNDNTLGRLVKMAHYGVPTRLLDITENLLVALYFATSEEQSSGEDGFVYCIKVGYAGVHYDQNEGVKKLAQLAYKDGATPVLEYMNPEDARKILFVHPKWSNPRIVAQQGAMLIFGCDGWKEARLSLKEQKGAEGEPFIVKTLCIPSCKKREILESLSLMGITPWSLFPDLEHLGMALKALAAHRELDLY